MKKLLTILILIISIDGCSQDTIQIHSLDTLSKKEFKHLLLNQTVSPRALALTKGHQNYKTFSSLFYLIGTVFIGNAIIGEYNENDPAPVILGVFGAANLGVGLILGGIAGEKLSKAKRIYKEDYNKFGSTTFKREKAIQIFKDRNSIKYPRPH